MFFIVLLHLIVFLEIEDFLTYILEIFACILVDVII